MKYFKLFNQHSEYETYINSNNKLLPNLSYCEDNDCVHFNPFVPIETRIFATVKGANATSRKLLFSDTLFSSIEIDGVVQPNIIKEYSFGDRDEHEIVYTLIDPTIIGSHAFQLCAIGNIIIPSTVIEIEESAFAGCNSLKTVEIPNNVNIIGKGVFNGCNYLESVIIGSGITSIGSVAFSGCEDLESVTIRATIPPTITNDTGLEYCSIYVPAESVNAYKTATNWSEYASRIQAIP